MTEYTKTNIFSILYGILIILLDQASKFSVLAFLNPRQTLEVCPYLNLTLTYNFGTSFGILSPRTELEYYLIIMLTGFLVVFLVIMFIKTHKTQEKLCLMMIIAGAIGNMMDRFIHGAVVDFIDMYYGDYHWPTFNVADSFISIGCLILIIMSLFSSGKNSKNKQCHN